MCSVVQCTLHLSNPVSVSFHCLTFCECWMLFFNLLGVELEVRVVVVVLCSVRDQFLTRSEEIVRVCILFVALSVALFVTLFVTLFCVFVWLFLLCKQFHVFLFIFFPSVLHILAIKSNSDSDFDEDVNQ